MATDGGFKHIKVTPAEEQEVVIHAGSPHTAEPAARTSVPAAVAPAEPMAEEPAAVPAAKGGPKGYQGTTLEDIQSSKMPKTQVAIIVVAVLAIIAFAVWYAFFS